MNLDISRSGFLDLALKPIKGHRRMGFDKLTMEEINAEIAAYRYKNG